MRRKKHYTLDNLQACLNYHFQDDRLLRQALTHGSAISHAEVRTTYQRLEFLGDRVLGLIIADLLFKSFPDAEEGELASRFNTLVRSETCAGVARDLDLGAFLIIGTSEECSGGRKKTAILGDIMESVIGAIYLDGGLQAVRLFVETHWKSRMLAIKRPPCDAKTLLQEWVQQRDTILPIYDIMERAGPDHAPVFKIRVTIAGQEVAYGTGGSRRSGEQAAATEMLTKLGLWSKDDISNE